MAVLLMLAVITAASVVLSASEGQESSSGDAKSSPVSPERVAEGLRRPELQIPPIPQDMPTFHVDITGTAKLETPLEAVRRELREAAGLPPWRGGTPVKPGIDILPALVGLVNKVKTIRHEHAEAEARQMVQQELAEFCSTHDCSQVVQEPLEGAVLVGSP